MKKLEAAAYAYHNGLEPVMTDEEYDAGMEALAAADPDNPLLKKVGAACIGGDICVLPIPLSSLNKIKGQEAIDKWVAKFGAPAYHVSAKLDGVSALWFPGTRKLYTRGDGIRGREISLFAPHFQGLLTVASVGAVRGELIMRTDSPIIPEGKLARNIVAGALNRKEVDPKLFAEIRFIAYELIEPAALSPEDGYKLLKTAGFETARSAILPAARLNAANLTEMFSTAEAKSPYQMDGLVVALNVARPAGYKPQVKGDDAVNPGDRVAWKTRVASATASARTTVLSVEWNVSAAGLLIPRVLFEPVALSGASIAAATGLHGRWIHDNAVGPGAVIEVRRAGDVIPQIIAVHTPAPGGPAMPARYEWVAAGSGAAGGAVGGAGVDPATAVHIKPVGDDAANATTTIRLVHALSELGAENVGPGIVAKLYAAGLRTIGAIYAASAADFAKLDGIKAKGAERIHVGLRAAEKSWTTLTFLVASSTMPRGVGHTKLTPLLALNPNPATWSAAELKAAKPVGLSPATIDAVVAAVPAFQAWIAETGLAPAAGGGGAAAAAVAAAVPAPDHQMTVVFTGVRDKALEATLQSMGHIVADAVTKKTTHVIYADDAAGETTKVAKAKSLGIPTQTLSEFKANLGL